MNTNIYIGAYIILILVIGYLSGRKQSSEDYMIADRNLKIPGFVGSIVASIVGAGMLVAYTAYVYEFGIGMLSMLLGVCLGYLLFGLVAKKIRQDGHKYDLHTIADFFHHHFSGAAGHTVALVTALIVTISILNQFIAGTQILVAISGHSYEISLLISAGVVLIYLILGGFRSVIRTDVFQYIVVLLLVLLLGGNMINMTGVSTQELFQNETEPSLIIAGMVYGFLLVWYSPDIWQRIYAAKDDKTVRWGLILASPFLLIVGLGITFIAASARSALPGIEPAQSFVLSVQTLVSPTLTSLGVIMLFAAVMSSADTLIFVLASNVAKDGVARFKKKKLSAKELRHITRWALIGIIIFGTTLAYFERNLINTTLLNAGIGMSLTPAIIGSLKWKLHSYAIIGSILAGLAYVTIWLILGNITPQTMVSTVLISAIFIVPAQFLFKRCHE